MLHAFIPLENVCSITKQIQSNCMTTGYSTDIEKYHNCDLNLNIYIYIILHISVALNILKLKNKKALKSH